MASTRSRDASQLNELALISGHYWTGKRALLPVLGAYLPRFGDGSPLSGLPKEVLRHIARLAYRPRITPKFELPSDAALREWMAATRHWRGGYDHLDVSFERMKADHELLDGGDALRKPHGADLARVLRFSCAGDYQYLELDFEVVWFGTTIIINDWELKFDLFEPSDDWEPTCDEQDDATVCGVKVRHGSTGDVRHVRAWDGEWENAPDANVHVALLFDPHQAHPEHGDFVHVAMNGIAGLSLPLDLDDLKSVQIQLRDDDQNLEQPTTDRIRCHAHVPAALAALATRPIPFLHAACSNCGLCARVG